MAVTRFDQQVSTTALPGARRSAAENDISAGVGVAEARQRTDLAAAQFGNTVADAGVKMTRDLREAADREKERADQVAVWEAQNKVVKQTNQWLISAQEQKGKAALTLPEQFNDQYTKLTADVTASLTTTKQKDAFQRFALEHGASTDMTVRRHTFQEMQTYEGEVLQATVDTAKDESISNAGDPRRVGQALGRAVDAVKAAGPRMGMPPEMVAAKVKDITSATFTGVIAQLIATDQVKAAQAYFDETKGQIKGEALAHIENALEEGHLRKEAQTQSDAIIGKGGTVTEQLEKVRAIENPKLRDEVQQRVEHQHTVNDRLEREAEKKLLLGVYDTLDRTGDVAKIPATIWSQMEPAQRAAARSYAASLAKGVKVETDFPTWVSLMKQASGDPEKFATVNILDYRAKLGDTEFKQLVEMQGAIVKGDRAAADRQSNNFRTHDEIIKQSLTNYGVDPEAKANTPQGQANAELYRLTALGVGQVESHLKPGQHATDQDIQAVVDHILSTKDTTPGSWWGLIPFNGIPLRDLKRGVIDLTIADVPAAQRTIIETQLRATGRAVSDATVLEAYQAMRVRTGR